MKLTKLFTEFFESEKTGGVILLACTIISLAVANSALGPAYQDFWNQDAGGHSIGHWINDGLMAVFFLLIGLELERELYIGELSSARQALLPGFAALGGMVVPAGLFLLFNAGTATQAGAGIPMATDIAFALGILSLLGSRVPAALKIFLTALAVIDDLGAILIIAIVYTGSLSWFHLLMALGLFAALGALNRLKVHNLLPYFLGGAAMWYFMSKSGVHATITGILLAFAIPFGDGGERSPSYRLQHWLHKPVAFAILPLFALANTAIPIAADWYQGLNTANSYGIIAGLVLGKPLGIVLFTWLAVSLGLGALNKDLSWPVIFGAGFLGGIGFTMSIFITLLAFNDAEVINQSKIAVMAGSLLAGMLGMLVLWRTLKPSVEISNYTPSDSK